MSAPISIAESGDRELVVGFLTFLEQYGMSPDEAASVYERPPVDVQTFITSRLFLNKPGVVYPEVMRQLIELNSGSYVEAVATGGIGCLTKDAEFLSPTGWVPMDQWDGHDIAVYDPRTKSVAFERPAEYIRRPSDGFYAFTRGSSYRLHASPEHRMLLHGRTGAPRVHTAAQVCGSVNRNSYVVPSEFSVARAGVALTDPQLRVMVAVLADGSFIFPEKSCRITIRKEIKKARLEALLNEAGIEFTVSGPYLSRPTEVTYRFKAPLMTKTFASFWECSTSQLKIIFDEVPYWDGLHPDSSPTSEWRFHTAKYDEAGFIQYLCHALGHRGVLRETVSGHGSRMWVVQARRNSQGYRLEGTNIEWQPPVEGVEKFCFVVSTGFFIVRDRGCVQITGNSGKTTLALYTTAYQLFLLSCMRDPHRRFGLDAASEILFIFQNKTAELAKEVDYTRFKSMIETAPYFSERFPFNPKVKSRLVFPNRIEVVPVSGQETAAIGQNVMGGVIDELNYMAVTEKSKKSVDAGTYDQAVAIYNSIARRRKSRFMQQGKLPGILCLVSSRRYPGQFTDRKEAEAKNDPTIFIYDKCAWDVKPDSYSGDTFPVFVGDLNRKPRILDDVTDVGELDRDLIRQIPVEHRIEFEVDIINALREIAGVSTLARHPFFVNQERVAQCFGQVDSILSLTDTDFVTSALKIRKSQFRSPDSPRFVHIDLGLTGDAAGIACGYVSRFIRMKRGDQEEPLPEVVVDFTLRVPPPKGDEINFEKIRLLLYKLRDLGLNIKWVSLDSFQSRDTIQILRQKGFACGLVSVDKDTVPYDTLKGCIYDGRLLAPEHPWLVRELASLERIPMKDKVDHPVGFSKDVGDALAGMVFGLTRRREIWVNHGISPFEIPVVVRETADPKKDAIKGEHYKEIPLFGVA